MTTPATDLGWHSMECGLCPETWWLPFGITEYGKAILDLRTEHWLGHVRRGEDPRIQGDAIKAYTGGTR